MSDDVDEALLSASIHDWIVRIILDDCMYTDLSLEDQKTRDAIVTALKSAASFFESYDRTLH
jgi:hypothetical protein